MGFELAGMGVEGGWGGEPIIAPAHCEWADMTDPSGW